MWTRNAGLHLECKAIDDLARLVRIGFLAGLCGAGNTAHESQGLRPIRLPMNLHMSSLEQRTDDWIEVWFVTFTNRPTPRASLNSCGWKGQLRNLKENAKNPFVSHQAMPR